METLLEAGADSTLRSGFSDQSVLDFAAALMRFSRGIDVNEAAGIDVDDETGHATSYAGFCALHWAARGDHVGAIDALVGAGANVELRAANGYTPFIAAAVENRRKAMLALLRHGACINSAGSRSTALHVVCSMSLERMEATVSLLLRWGADETALDGDGKTPADLVNLNGDCDEPLSPEDVERVRLLLARAPAQRAWRRRGWLVMLVSRSLRARAARPVKRQSTTMIAGGGQGLDLVVVVAALSGELQEVFRTIVSFL